MKIAIPLWQDRVAPLLDCCSKLKVFELKEGQIQVLAVVDLSNMSLAERLKVLRSLQLDLVICNGISFFYRACLLINAIKVVANITGEEEKVMAELLNSRIKE